MIFGLALFIGILWFALTYIVLYAKQTPEAQVRRRLAMLIKQAQTERAKLFYIQKSKDKKNSADNINKPDAKEQAMIDKTFSNRVIRPIIRGIENRLRQLAPKQIRKMLEDRIFRAGKQGVWSVNRLILFWVISIVLVTCITFFAIQNSTLQFLQRIMIIILGGFIGATLPFAMLNANIRQRQKKIRKQLPEFLDILCVSVQAGLSFDGAVAKIATKMKGPLIVEFKRMQSDVSLGMTRQYALTQMAKRCDLEEVYLFTTSIIQAEKLGTSMSKTLKMQADNMRDRHRQFVKSEAMKAPVKIIFPMVLFIFPSIFVVLLFPAVLQLVKTLGN